ncbi:MAG: hypothetical protein JNN05_05625 [Candidatus Omnitrophica bacterium]|nr:hypothetical protein [Candidatus Omnitrophota bacterium]
MISVKTYILITLLLVACLPRTVLAAEENIPARVLEEAMFDDRLIFNGYVSKFKEKSKEVIVAMMNDTTVSGFQLAAVLSIFRDDIADQAVGAEKNSYEKTLLRILAHEDSPFVQAQTMSALIALDRYKYFKVYVPKVIEKLDHYNDAVVEIAYADLTIIVSKSTARTREARIIFNTLRKMLFLSRKKLESINEPDEKLRKKLDLLFWTIKVLGTQELNQLPPEVIRLLSCPLIRFCLASQFAQGYLPY